RDDARIFVVGQRSTTLHVKQRVVPGIAGLAGEQAESVDLHLVGDQWENEAGGGAVEVGPVALRLDAEHPIVGLPAVTGLAADSAAGAGEATLRCRREGDAEQRVVGPATAIPAAAAVESDIEAAPVVD